MCFKILKISLHIKKNVFCKPAFQICLNDFANLQIKLFPSECHLLRKG